MSVFQVLRLSVPLSANTMPQADSQQESNPFRGIRFSSGEGRSSINSEFLEA